MHIKSDTHLKLNLMGARLKSEGRSTMCLLVGFLSSHFVGAKDFLSTLHELEASAAHRIITLLPAWQS
jgi:hypothetical protein